MATAQVPERAGKSVLEVTDLVMCRSDSEYAERPIAVIWEGQRWEVVEILARWRTPGGKCFRVSIQDGQTFELFYDETTDAWRVTPG